MELEKIKNDTALYQKVLLAYWYSIPSDSDRSPTKITIKFEDSNVICYMLWDNDINYGGGTMPQRELINYIKKLNKLDDLKDDIVKRFDEEGDSNESQYG